VEKFLSTEKANAAVAEYVPVCRERANQSINAVRERYLR
jgi:hypothetical protein